MKNEEIYRLLDERDKKFDAQVESINKTLRYGLKGMRQYIDAGFETIDRADQRRNGRIEKLEESNNDLNKWCIQSKTRNKIIWAIGGASLTALWGLVVTQWDKIFG